MRRDRVRSGQRANDYLNVHILHKLPTPYNDDLFIQLNARDNVHLQVHHLWRGSWRRPWQTELGVGYPNRYMKLFVGIDWSFLAMSLRQRKAFFMIGDWGHLAALVVIVARIAIRAPVAIWTDTPQEDLPRPLVKRWLRGLLLRFLLSQADTVFASGAPGVRVVKSMGARADRVVNLPMFVDLERPARVRAANEGRGKDTGRLLGSRVMDSPCVFAMVGTLVERKGHDIGIRAFADCLSRVGERLQLLIAGEGPERFALERLAADLHISQSVRFLGWLEPDEMDELYIAADVLVHPARWDPYPLVVLEAMSWGKVVIASDVCGSAVDRIESGTNGFLVREGDVAGFAETFLEMAENEPLRNDVGRAARTTAEKWPMSRGVDTIVSVAEHVLRGGRQ